MFMAKRRKMVFDNAMFILSVDIDVGSKKLAVLNNGKYDKDVSSHFGESLIGEVEERVLPKFVDIINCFEIAVTFAIRGQMLEVDSSIIDLLQDSPISHDIGAHGYYHRSFTEISQNEAERELREIRLRMGGYGIFPKSFVFPRNHVAHLDLLKRYGYKCYRGPGGFLRDNMSIERCGALYNICPSMYISLGLNPFLLRKIVDLGIIKKTPLHFWLHLWNFGQDKEHIERNTNKILIPILKYVKKKERNGMLTLETMCSAAKKAEERLNL
jgi:peptidoglycan/xylan/chitin deacetylase (PgdA/CDA1 family)